MKTNTTALCALSVLFCLPLFSQVGINNTSPKSLLDITVNNASAPANTDGILIPRLNSFPAINPGSDQNGMMIFLTTPIGVKNKGFYYWDAPNNVWVSIGAEEWTAGKNLTGDNLIYATRAKLSGTDMVITDDGRIGFGTSDPVERFEFRGPGDNDFQITSANPNPPNFILYNTGGTLDVPAPLASNGEIGSFIVKTHDGTAIRENGGFRFYMDGVATSGSTPSRFVINTTPTGSVSQVERIIVRSTGNIGFGEINPTASLHIRRGTAVAGSAPLKFISGINLTTPEAGAIEYDGTNLYFSPTAANRRTVLLSSTNISTGKIGVNIAAPTANVHISAGTATAASAPLKFTSGTNLTTPEAGAMEFDGTNLFFTPGTVRQTVMKGYATIATLDFPNITPNNSADLTVTVTGAVVGDNCYASPSGAIEPGISWNCFVSAPNIVTIRVANIIGAAIDPASRSWKVNVIK